ncbi:hypothetical protein A3B42_03085 [Candidatus Daviesbacteria bacterium RIFCSPLOWO2_01_FULL_38_10]|nr:MAG: hypothetical protein A3B42_03085 [Candidatus Daviesbacteria bacterium RIFCSPLOWO2_01_FULL_38_10]OGE44717.1 MAG: hypothetical protein A3E67_02780 [Candidatus Daviesbacteria bacterium RIFCSPHIGHO2_12_FULL_38_25]OGE68883.1 MAG: hypothetical protein A3H81_05080 [Candidatus Daviesbacteria bacterium RIFCSPLOWO2_02_FULL_38_18]HBQ50461.1 hypothetical protein [Candidatus Daviesbacteria bacterium]HCB23057.1 hypothetical protein [Candidatus Daviesbacteria bacterium]
MKLTRKLSSKAFYLSQSLILIFGLIFLSGLYYILNSPQNNSSYTTRGPVTILPKSLRIDLDLPEENLLTFQPSVIVSGNTLPFTQVLITTDSQDLVIESKKDGSFSTVIKLDKGVNNLTAVVFGQNGESKSIERTVYYSKEKI